VTAVPSVPGPGVWTRARAALLRRVGERNFAAWIAPLRPEWTDGGLALRTPDAASRDRIERHFLAAIEDALAEAAGRACSVQVALATPPAPLPIPVRAPSAQHSFDRFLGADSNRTAVAAARGLVEDASPNPLFVHGPSGVGKTHLLHAIFHALDAAGLAVACLSARELVDALVARVAAGSADVFWRELRPLGALLLDDVHSLRGREETQEHLVEGLARWLDAHRLLVLTSDRAPAELPALMARLANRFARSTVAAIAPPEPALRIAILLQRAADAGVTLDPPVAACLAAAVGGNVRRLEGALNRLVAHARLRGRPLDETLAREVLPELGPHGDPALTVDRIVAATARAFRVPSGRLRGRARSPEAVRARQVAMFLARRLLARPFAELGAAFDRDHAAVLHACRTIAARLERDRALRAVVRDLERELGPEAAR